MVTRSKRANNTFKKKKNNRYNEFAGVDPVFGKHSMNLKEATPHANGDRS